MKIILPHGTDNDSNTCQLFWDKDENHKYVTYLKGKFSDGTERFILELDSDLESIRIWSDGKSKEYKLNTLLKV